MTQSNDLTGVDAFNKKATNNTVAITKNDSTPPRARLKQDTNNTAAITLGHPYTDSQYTKLHLAITADDFLTLESQGGYPLLKNPGASMVVMQIIDPTREDFLHLLQCIGGPYGWDKRKKYQKEQAAQLDDMMADPETRLYKFYRNGEDIGGCLVTAIKQNMQDSLDRKEGISKEKAVQMFARKRGIYGEEANAIEINKIGFYPEFTGQGYGQYFIPRIVQIQALRAKYDVIYLDTRSTNHAKVIKFYEDLGIKVFHKEKLSADLVDAVPKYKPKSAAHIPVAEEPSAHQI